MKEVLMKYLLILMLLVGCDTPERRALDFLKIEVGTCITLPHVDKSYFRVVSVGKYSFMAGGYYPQRKGVENYKKFNKMYPAEQISQISKTEKRHRIDCPRTEEWMNQWDIAVNNEYLQRKDQYSEDAKRPDAQ